MKYCAVLWLLLTLLGCEPKAHTAPGQTSDLVQINSAQGHKHGPDEGGHNHGAARLNVVLDGDALSVQIQIAALDAVGFEQPAQTDAQQAALAKALKSLQSPDVLFSLPMDASCTLTQGEVKTALLNTPGSAIEHADFDVQYHWQCTKPQALHGLQIRLFSQFPALQKINGQYVVHAKQGARVLIPGDKQLEFE